MGFVHGVVVEEDAAGGDGVGALKLEMGGDVAVAEAGGSDVVSKRGGGEGFTEEVFVADEGDAGVKTRGGVEVDAVVVEVGVEAEEDGVDVSEGAVVAEEEGVEGVAELGDSGAVEELGIVEAAEGVGVFLIGKK